MSKKLSTNLEYILHFLRGIILGGGLVFGLVLGYRLTPYALEVASDVQSSEEVSVQSIKESLPQVFAVYSGSMEPAIMTGSALISVPSDFYIPGDVITFTSQGKTITHRVVEKLYEGDTIVYKTKGDANEEADAFTVTHDSIQGKLALTVPQLGYVFEYAKKPQGFILLVIVPATIIIYEELKYVFLSIKRLGKRIYKKVRKASDEPKSDQSMRVSPLFTLIPLIGSIFVITAFTASYFLDVETSRANTLGVSHTYNVVLNEILYKPDVSENTEWIEIHNAGDEVVNLTNWTVEIGPETFSLVSLPNIQPGEYLSFDLPNNTLSNTNETSVRLIEDTIIRDIHTYTPSDTSDTSIGRGSGGTAWNACVITTKGASNNENCN